MKLNRGSSSHFCILAAVFRDNASAEACDLAISDLRRTIGKPASYEFHFSHCPDSARLAFMRCVAAERFDYHAFVIDKRKLYSPKFTDAKYFYEFAVNIVCDNAGDLITDAKVVIDRNGNREFLQRLQKSLRLRSTPMGRQIVKKVIMQDSRANNLVQLADMTCGAIARSITSNDFTYRNLIRNKGHEQRVQCWPK